MSTTDFQAPLGTSGTPSDDSGSSSKASAVKDASKEQAGAVAGEAKTQAKQLGGRVAEQLQGQAGTQRDRAATSLRSVGDELKQLTDSSDASGPATTLIAQAGDRAHSFAGYLEDRDPKDLLTDLNAFARKRPAAFLVGALIAGVAAGRLTRGIKSAHEGSTPAVDTGRRLEPRSSVSYGTSTPAYVSDDVVGSELSSSRSGFADPLAEGSLSGGSVTGGSLGGIGTGVVGDDLTGDRYLDDGRLR